MDRKRNGLTILVVILAAMTMLGVVAVSHAEDCPDQGGKGRDRGIFNPPDTNDKKHGCDDETTKTNENNGSGNDTDCEDDNNGRLKPGCVVLGTPTLTISKAGSIDAPNPDPGPDPGDTITYVVTFGNSGTASATNVVVRDIINEGLTGGACERDQTTNYVQGSATSTIGTVSFGNGAVTVTIASLGSQTGTLTFKVSVPDGTFHDCNRATIEAGNASPATSNTVGL